MEYEPTESEIEEIKAINGWVGTEHDLYLEIMIPLLFEHVIAYCNNTFLLEETGIITMPGGVKLFIAKACEHNLNKSGVKSRSMGSVSYSYDLDFPSTLMRYLRPYRRLKFHATR